MPGIEILIGAGQQGKDPAFTNAQLIWVEENAHFLAELFSKPKEDKDVPPAQRALPLGK